MWERWNSYSHADGFGDANMNSFNHYAYGAIGQFMYERIAGLSPDPEHPGYKHFFIRPLIGGPLESASAELDTPYGPAKSSWAVSDGKISIDVVVPPNTSATFLAPTGPRKRVIAEKVLVNGLLLSKSKLSHQRDEKERLSVKIGPGTYQFQITTSN